MTDPSERKTPPETDEEWAYIWTAVRQSHESWPLLRVQIALFGNWKIIMVGVIIGLALAGTETLQAWGFLK
jgi:hypothetical protein